MNSTILFCRAGLSDEMRANFNLMKEMGNHTRQEPAVRVRSLKTFANRIADNPETKKMLEEWKLAFNRDLVQLRARLMEPEEIRGAGSSKFKYKVDNADWSPAFRNWKQWSVVECRKWAVIVSRITYSKPVSHLFVSAPAQC